MNKEDQGNRWRGPGHWTSYKQERKGARGGKVKNGFGFCGGGDRMGKEKNPYF